MPRHTIDIGIDVSLEPDLDRRWLRGVVRGTLVHQALETSMEVALLLTSDETVHRLNKEYRGVDEPTDVLSFGPQGAEDAFPEVPGDGFGLGQVVVSYPQAVQQAREYGHSVKREVAFLTVHGILHLLGYDHEDPVDESRMFVEQEAVLQSLGIMRE